MEKEGCKKNFKSEPVYETIVNGRVNFSRSGKNLLERRKTTYLNSKTGKMQTQNYFYMEDIVVPVILRRNENDQLEFAMIYEYIPAVNKVFLELPECPFFNEKKSHYDNKEVSDVVDRGLLDMGLDMEGFRYLDSSETAVSQSFTDQQAKFVAVHVKQFAENKELQWFPISSISDFFARIGDNSSLQTKYALQLFLTKYKNEILKLEPTAFNFNTEIVGKPIGDWKDKKNIMEHKYRFGIELSENDNPENQDDQIPDLGQVSEYGLSKNSSNCLIVKRANGKLMVGLSKQQRSPFIDRDDIDEYFYEFVGGMVEDGESTLEAAKRETAEETGVNIRNLNIIHIETPTLASKSSAEYGDFYLCEIQDDTQIDDLSLDEQENISRMEWFDLYGIDLEKMQIPLGTKYIIEKTRDYYEKKRIKTKEYNSENPER